jgi:4-hydroxybenzoate polyprenyltransferase
VKPREPISQSLWVEWVSLLRPKQWTKNIFVLAPLLFSEAALSSKNVVFALLAFVVFCLLASATYILNDMIDMQADRLHPGKCRRPIAAGRIRPAPAAVLAIGLVVAAAIVCEVLLPRPVLVFAGFYITNSILYCLWLKSHVIADVLVIAIGFVLRLLGGSAAINVEPSSWLVVCGFSLAMVLGFGKRRTEVEQLADRGDIRSVLKSYTPAKLDTLLSITSAVALLAYILFTVAPETVRRHHTSNLIYTVPFVAYGLFRYLFKVQEGKGYGPTEILLSDPVFALTGLLWTGSILIILYL